MADNQLVPQPEVPGASFGPAIGGFAAGPFKNFIIGALRDFGDPIHKMAFPESPSEFVQGLGGTMLGMAAPMGAKAVKPLADVGMKAYKEALGTPTWYSALTGGAKLKKPAVSSKFIKDMSEEEYAAYKSTSMTPSEWVKYKEKFTAPPELPAEPLPGKLYGTKDIGFSPTATSSDQFVVAGGKKIGEITAAETKADPHLLYMYHWGKDAPARELPGMAAAKQAALKSATGIEQKPTWMDKPGAPQNYQEWLNPSKQYSKFLENLTPAESNHYFATVGKWSNEESAASHKAPLSEEDITKALAKNPGASIFDIAGIKDKANDVFEAIGAPVNKLIDEGKYQYRKLTGAELQSPPVPKWGEKGFPWPQGEFAERAKQGGFTTPAWSGQNRYKFTEFTKENPGGVVPEEVPQQIPFRGGKTYMSSSPKLADMYGSSMETHPDTEVYFSRNAVNVPLLLNTDKFHKVDAKGRIWTEVNEAAIDAARRKNAPGVTVKNVYDEPNPPFNRALGHPTDVHIVFEGAGTARSPFAKFDPSKFNTNDLLAGLGGGAISAPLLMGDSGAQR